MGSFFLLEAVWEMGSSSLCQCCWCNFLFHFFIFQQQRTVYRLTLVKAWNVDELKAYADLVSLGKPDFIEVKVSCTELLLPSVFSLSPPCFPTHRVSVT